ncbi:Uncharacterised protein [Klebsiella pneumoniae]|nr:Uncharacterised protein [Klebsiella pneumoniae]
MTTGNQTDHLLCRGTEGRRTLTGIQYPETAGGTRAHINQPSAQAECLCHRIHHLRHLRQCFFHGKGHGLVFTVNHPQHI